MEPLIQEFIIVQNDLIMNKNDKNNSTNKIAGLIVVENMTIQEDMKIIKKVNFNEINNLKNTIKEIIEMTSETSYNIIKKRLWKDKKKSKHNMDKRFIMSIKKDIFK